MNKIILAVWDYYLVLEIFPRIPKGIFIQRLRRFMKTRNRKLQNFEIYDFIFLKILKKNVLKWAKIFEENKFRFK